MKVLASILEQSLDTPVVDFIGLSGEYEMDWPELTGDNPGDKLESARDALRSFGLTCSRSSDDPIFESGAVRLSPGSDPSPFTV